MKKAFVLIILCVVLLSGCGAASGNSKHEQLALDYINQFVNSSDAEEKAKFLEDHIHPEIQPLFQLGLNAVSNEDSQYVNAKVLGSSEYNEEDVVDGAIVLISADGDKEAIVLINEGKIAFLFTPTSELIQGGYEELKAQIKV